MALSRPRWRLTIAPKTFRTITTGTNGEAGTIATITTAGAAIGTDGGGAAPSFGPNGTAITGGGTIPGTPVGTIGGVMGGGGRIRKPPRFMITITAIMPPPTKATGTRAPMDMANSLAAMGPSLPMGITPA